MPAPAHFLVALLALAPLLAGCVAGPDESTCEQLTYVSIQYADVLDPERLRAAFSERGWDWESTDGNRTAVLEPPREMASRVSGLVSFRPGPSAADPSGGIGTLISFEETQDFPEAEEDVPNVASAASDIVNATYEDPPPIDSWIHAAHDAGC